MQGAVSEKSGQLCEKVDLVARPFTGGELKIRRQYPPAAGCSRACLAVVRGFRPRYLLKYHTKKRNLKVAATKHTNYESLTPTLALISLLLFPDIWLPVNFFNEKVFGPANDTPFNGQRLTTLLQSF